MELRDVVETSGRVAATRARLAKVEQLAALLARASPTEAPIVASYLVGEIPGGRISVGPAMLREARGAPPAGGSLALAEVQLELEGLRGVGGPGAKQEKLRRLGALFGRVGPEEREFLARLVVGELRQGALAGVMIDAVARAHGLPRAAVRRATMLAGDVAAVAAAAAADGPAGLGRFRLRPFRPLQPMLAQPAEDVAGALALVGRAGLEHKLDGARVQLHKAGDEVRVYTRRLNDVTPAVPELVELGRTLPARQVVLDGEVVALRPDGHPHPFQTTMRRFGRRLDVEALRARLPLSAFFFDALLVDDDVLIDRPAAERLAALDALLPAGARVPRLVTADPVAARAFLAGALAAGHEGVMAKSLEAPYEAGARGGAWLKVKPVHTLDLVVLAAEWGSGRRRGWLSNLHLGCRDPERGGFCMLGKTFKGLTDETLAWQTEALLAREIGRDAWTVYVRPELVVEIAFGELQVSPHYPGGLALRFARVRRYRPDKRPEDADTLATARALHAGGAAGGASGGRDA